MTDLFQYNPTPWVHARCGDNWDINLPHEADAKGVGVVATCFAGEDIARLIAAAPELYEAVIALLDALDARNRSEADEAWNAGRAALAKARGEA